MQLPDACKCPSSLFPNFGQPTAAKYLASMYIEQTMVQSVVRIVQPHMECRKHKNIPLVPLAKNAAAKTDALFTGLVGLQRLQLVSLGVFTA